MHIDFTELEKKQAYRFLCHTVIPRPVAWVLTQSPAGNYNIAPFSYFNIVCSDPAIVMISVGHKRDGNKKDTWTNLETGTDAVIHIADFNLLKDLNQTAKSLANDQSELDEITAEVIEQQSFPLPRIRTAAVALNCKRHDIHLLGNGPQAVIYLQVASAYISDELAADNPFMPDANRLNPIARLGAEDYSLLGDIHTLKRPT
jgi:flavin reductase (DIM6/NTAB) family NADH-FMN oxidoreductase RutF